MAHTTRMRLTCCQLRRLAHGQLERELDQLVHESGTSGEEHVLPGLHETKRWRGQMTGIQSGRGGPCAAGGTELGQAFVQFRICTRANSRQDECNESWTTVCTRTATESTPVPRRKKEDTHWLDCVLPGLNARTGRLGPSSRADTRAPSRTASEEST